MSTNQPVWKLVAQLGDADPVSYGGYFIYEDTTGVYEPEAEWLEAPESDEGGEWTVYRFSLDKCTLTAPEDDGAGPYEPVLSDNKFHPLHAAWFAKREGERKDRPQDSTYLSNVADFIGVPLDTLREWFCSERLNDRAEAYRAVGEYHGFDNLDQYPLAFTDRAEVEARYAQSAE